MASSGMMFIKLKGAQTGDIKGEAVQKGHEGWIEVESFSWGAVSPRDPASGLATGKRSYREFKWVSLAQRSSPLLMTAFARNENLTEATVEVSRLSSKGTLEDHLTFKFTNASLSSFDLGGAEAGLVSEEFALVFQKVEVTHEPSGTVFTDDWSAPIS